MIDLHCHILPDVDDGPADWDSSLAMMAIAAGDGIRTMVATPHSHDLWRGDGTCEAVIPQLAKEATRRAVEAGLEIEVLPGQECMIHPRLAEEIQTLRHLTLGWSSTVLVELPFTIWPPFTEEVVFDLQVAGFIVLLAHPERYQTVQEDPNCLLPLLERGVLTQVTSSSIVGNFGKNVQSTARLLVEHGFSHVLASDSHSSGRRSPRLAQARAMIADWIGEEEATRMVWDTPNALIHDKPVDIAEPRAVQAGRRRIFGLF